MAQNTKVNHFPSPFSHLAQPYQIWQAFVNFLEVLFRKACNLGEFGSTEGPERNQLGLADSGWGGGNSLQEKKTGLASTLRKPSFSVTDSSILDKGLCSGKIYPLSNSNVIPRSAAWGARGAQPTPSSPSTFFKCQRWPQLTLQAPIQALHESPTRRLALAWTPPVDKSAPPCQHGSPPGRPRPFESLRSMVRGGQPGPQESLRRGKRRPHLDPDLVGGEAAPADPHCLRVAHIDLEEVAGRPVGVIQVLRLGDQPPGVRHGLRHFAAAAAAAAAPPRTPSAPSAFYRHLRRRCCCPPRGHQARAQRSQGERARRAGVHPHARSSSPRPSDFRLLCPGGKQLTCRNFAPETRETQRKPRKGTGSRQRRGNAVLELGGANRFRPDYRAHNAPGERAPAGLKQSCYELDFRVGIGFRVGLGLEQWKEH